MGARATARVEARARARAGAGAKAGATARAARAAARAGEKARARTRAPPGAGARGGAKLQRELEHEQDPLQPDGRAKTHPHTEKLLFGGWPSRLMLRVRDEFAYKRIYTLNAYITSLHILFGYLCTFSRYFVFLTSSCLSLFRSPFLSFVLLIVLYSAIYFFRCVFHYLFFIMSFFISAYVVIHFCRCVS